MIILLIIIFAALAIVGFFFIPNTAVSWIVGVLATLLLALSIVGLVVHDNSHWGMKKVETTSTTKIYTAGDTSQAYGMMIKSPLGSASSNYLLMYRTDEKGSVQAHFATKAWSVPKKASGLEKTLKSYMTKHAVEASKKTSTYELVNSNRAERVVRTTRWEFSSGFMNMLFGVGGEEGELVKQTTTVKVPKDTWLVLTAAQVTKLESAAPEIQKQQEAEVQAKIAAAPTPEAKAGIAAAAQAQAAQIAEMQKNDPKAYAKLQVQQLRQLLGIKD